MSTLNEKAAKRRAERKEKKIRNMSPEAQTVLDDRTNIERIADMVKVDTTPQQPQNPNSQTSAEIKNDIRQKVADDIRLGSTQPAQINPAMATPVLSKPAELSGPDRLTSTKTVESTPVVDTNPTTDTQTTQVVETKSTTDTPSTPAPEANTPTWNDLLATLRENHKADLTDAIKMQKYHALTDALNAIGKMGGAAIGGAIGGGNILDSAPNVGEYKESRGYLDAFERAKQANDRLRALDEKEFNLLYNKQQKDEDRAYNDAVRKEERAYREEMAERERAWQKELTEYRAKIERAIARGNMKLKAKLEAEMNDKQMAHEKEMKELSKQIVMFQNGFDVNGNRIDKTIPFTFNDGSVANIPEYLYPEMLSSFADMGKIGDDFVDEENVRAILRKHPELVNRFLISHSGGTVPVEEVVEVSENDAQPEQNEKKKTWWEKILTMGPDVPDGYTYAGGMIVPSPIGLNNSSDSQAQTNSITNTTVDNDGVEWEQKR